MGIFVVALVAGLILLANHVRQTAQDTYYKLYDVLLMMLNTPVFLLGVFFVFLNEDQWLVLQSALGVPLNNPMGLGIVLQGTAVWGISVSFRSTRHSLERWLPLNPHSSVHELALVLSGYLVANALIALTQGGVTELAQTVEPITVWQFAAQQVAFVVTAVLGVGLWQRRNFTAVLQRLGLTPITWRQLLEGVAWIGVLVVAQSLAGSLWTVWQPDRVAQVESLGELLYANIDTVGEWLLLALTAGIGEELLFRGALQPALGWWFTAVLFAVSHIQYGFFTLATLVLFIFAGVLALIRRRHNTTTAIFVHAGYNFVLGLISYWAVTAV